MVTRQTTLKRRTTTKRRVPLATTGAKRMEEAKTQFHVAERKLQKAGRAASAFARSYMREMTAAVQASREPVHSLWLTMRRTGRHIARDATAAWREVVPLRAKTAKPTVARMGRHTPA